MKKVGILILSVLFFTSNSNAQKHPKISKCEMVDAKKYALIGKKGITTFPKMKVETDYISDSTMHWKTTNSKGEIAEGDEKISYEKLSNNLHFLNWVEKNGYVISLTINTKDGKVKAFWSYANESARGKRGSAFNDGKFELVK
jgi:hypothetical protein